MLRIALLSFFCCLMAAPYLQNASRDAALITKICSKTPRFDYCFICIRGEADRDKGDRKGLARQSITCSGHKRWTFIMISTTCTLTCTKGKNKGFVRKQGSLGRYQWKENQQVLWHTLLSFDRSIDICKMLKIMFNSKITKFYRSHYT